MTNFGLGQDVLVYDILGTLSPEGGEICRGSVSRVTGTSAWVTVPAEVAVEPLRFGVSTGLQLSCHPRFRIRDVGEAAQLRRRSAVATLLGHGLTLAEGSDGILGEQLEAIARILDHEPQAWTYGRVQTAVECSCGGTYSVPALPAARLVELESGEESALLDEAHAAHVRAVVSGSV